MRYQRPSLRVLVLAAATATMISALLAFSRPIEMIVDGQRVESDVPPVTSMLGDKIYVPIRSLADALGAQTSIEGQNIYVVRGRQSLRLRAGDVHATINGMPFTLKHPPFRVRGRMMVGLKAVARVFGIRANYDARTASVQVMTPGIGEANEPAAEAQAQ